MNALPGYDNWLSAPYDNQPEPIEPTELQFDDAMDALVADGEQLSNYLDGQFEDFCTLVQTYSQRGLPIGDKSEKDDVLRDVYDTVFTRLVEGFRDVMTDSGKLAARAQAIAEDAADDD